LVSVGDRLALSTTVTTLSVKRSSFHLDFDASSLAHMNAGFQRWGGQGAGYTHVLQAAEHCAPFMPTVAHGNPDQLA
jgi:hypothetical protein